MTKSINDWHMPPTWKEAAHRIREDMMLLQQEFSQYATKKEAAEMQATISELSLAVQSIPTAEAIAQAIILKINANQTIPPIERSRLRLEGWRLVVTLITAILTSGGLTALVVALVGHTK